MLPDFLADLLMAQGSLKRRKRFITQGKIRETESSPGFEKAGKLSRPVVVLHSVCGIFTL